MSGIAKLLTAGGGGVSLTPASSIASDVTVNVPVTGVSGGTLVCSDSSGNVGIGTSSPANKLHIESSEAIIRLKDTDATGYTLISANNTRAGLYFQADPSNDSADSDIRFSVDNTERMRIDSSGNVLIGETSFLQSGNQGLGVKWTYANSSNGGQGGVEFYNASTSSNSDANPALVISKGSTTTTSSARFIQFYCNVTAQPMGGIVGNGATNVQFASLSDAREKNNIEPVVGSLEKVLSLKPVSFNWNVDGSHVNAGFVAQDVQQVFPEFVVENIANAGEEERLGLTGGMTGGIIAHLVKAIQELKSELDATKAEVAALKGAA